MSTTAEPASQGDPPLRAPAPHEAAAAAASGEGESAPQAAARPRIFTGELISFAAALILLPIMFLLDWYGVVGLPLRARRSGITTAENAWRVLTDLRWLMLLTIVAAVGSVLLHVSQRSHGARTDTSLLVAGVGALNAALVAYRVLIDPPHSSSVVDVKIGAFLGLLCAIGIAIGGYESVRQEQDRGGRVMQKSRAKSRTESHPDAR